MAGTARVAATAGSEKIRLMNGSRPLEDFRLGLRFPSPQPAPPTRMMEVLGSISGVGFSFALDWARLQPRTEGSLDTAALDEVRRHWEPAAAAGADLVISLQTGLPPQTLIDRGGWSSRDAIGRFADYAAAVALALGDSVVGFVLLEDPMAAVRADLQQANPWAPRGAEAFLRGTHVLNLALAESTRAIRAERPECSIGRHVRTALCEPFGDSDTDACERFHRFVHHWFLEPARSGQYPDAFVDGPPDQRLDLHSEDSRLLVAAPDFVQLEVGPRLRVEAVADEFGLEAVPRPVESAALSDPELRAEALEGACLQLSQELPDLPQHVTSAAPDGFASSAWRSFHDAALEGACGAREKGAAVRSYQPTSPRTGDLAEPDDTVTLRWLVDTLHEGRFET